MHKLALLLPAALSTQALAAPQLVDLVSSLSGLLGGSVAQGPAPTGCSDYEVIIGRGTGEPGPFGLLVGDPLMAAIKPLLPSARGYAVQYPASMDASSEDLGGQDVAQRLATQTAQCPSQKFALVGYSQGSRTIRKGLRRLEEQGGQVKERVWDAVKAVVTYGDAGYRASENATRPSPPMPEEMVSAGIVKTNCAKGDPACDHNASPMDRSGHLTYNSAGKTFHSQTAKFIVAAFKGEPLPPFNQNPMR